MENGDIIDSHYIQKTSNRKMSIYRERRVVKIQSMKTDQAVLMRENIIIALLNTKCSSKSRQTSELW